MWGGQHINFPSKVLVAQSRPVLWTPWTVAWKKLWVLAQLRLTLCDTMDGSLPGSSVHGIFQVRILEWVSIFLLQGILSIQGLNLSPPALAGGFVTTAPPWKPNRETIPTLKGVAGRMGRSATSPPRVYMVYGSSQSTGLPEQGVGPFPVQVRPLLQLGLRPSFLVGPFPVQVRPLLQLGLLPSFLHYL